MDADFHVQYVGTTAVRIYRRKQDTKRTGYYPRLGRSTRVEWDLAQRLKQHAETHGLEVSEQCGEPGGALSLLYTLLLH